MYKNILVLDDGTEIQASQTGSAITGLVYTSTVSSTTDLCPGAACSGKLEFTVWVDPGASLVFTSGTRVRYYQQDDAGARTLVGTFWAVKPTKASRNTYKVYAYDAVSKLDGIQSAWLRSIQSSFPMSLWAFTQAVAQQCGVTLANTKLPHSLGYQVQAFYADDLTGRQLLSWVAEASCSFLRATPGGEIEFAWYEQIASTGIYPDGAQRWTALDLSGRILTCSDGSIWTFGQISAAYRSGGLSYEEYSTAPLDKVQIAQSDADVGVIYPPDETGQNALVIQGNLLLTTESADALRPVAQAIYEEMQRISYTPLKASLFSDGRVFAPGQIITATDPWGNALQSYIMTVQQEGGKISVESTGNASRDGTAAVNQQAYRNLRGKMLEIQADVDGLSVKARELAGNFTDLNLTVEGITTRTENLEGDYTQIQTSVDGLKVETQNLSGQYTQINSTVNGLTTKTGNLENDYTALKQDVNGLDVTVVKKGQVRTQFAADADSVTINSGLVTFTANTLAIESDNFQLTPEGNVTATGNFNSQSGTLRASVLNGGFFSYQDGELCSAIYGYTESGQDMGSMRCYGQTNSGGRHEFAVLRAGLDGGQFAMTDANGEQNVQIIGGVIIARGLGISGEKNRIVTTSYGRVKMHAVESPKPRFEDVGTGTCDENGLCLLTMDPRFEETISRHHSPIWQVTPTAPGALWVENGPPAIVHGQPGQTFNWAVSAPQIGYEDQYADPWDDILVYSEAEQKVDLRTYSDEGQTVDLPI